MSKRITIYCASSRKVPEKYFLHTREIAKLLAQSNHHIVYGGGAVGLMGTLADTVIEHNGKITGIMPSFMKDVEWNHPKVCLLYTSPSPRDLSTSRMPSSA